MKANLILAQADVVTPFEVCKTNVFLENELITQLSDSLPSSGADVMDCSDCYVTPGLIDLQLNGGPSCDFWSEPSKEDVIALCRDQLACGVTTFLPTLITDDMERMMRTISHLEKIGAGKIKLGDCPARMPYVHLEGPCLSPNRPGVHPKEWLKPLTINVVSQLLSPSVGLMTVAPELDPSGDCISFLIQKGIRVALGHSDADFKQAKTAFERGVSMITHTFNALRPFHHRDPGPAVAAFLSNQVSCCLIADGEHLAPETVMLIHKVKGDEHTILVTDGARIGTSGGSLVGSSLTLDQGVRNLVNWSVTSFPQAIRMASYNPARAIGLEDQLGVIKPGAYADLVVWDKKTLEIKHTIVDGALVSS